MNLDPNLCRHFVERAKRAIAPRPEILHHWSIDEYEDHCIWEIKGQGEPGYDIVAEVDATGVTLSAEGWHDHYPPEGDWDEFVSGVLGLIRDMLGPAMRIREVSAGGTPFRWTVEHRVDGVWEKESECSLVFWNWFGKRTERFYVNTVLEERGELNEWGS